MARSSAPFKCPVCGAAAFMAVHVRRPSGNWYRTPFYRCFGCSVMFEDPDAFAGNRVTGDGVDRAPKSFARGDLSQKESDTD